MLEADCGLVLVDNVFDELLVVLHTAIEEILAHLVFFRINPYVAVVELEDRRVDLDLSLLNASKRSWFIVIREGEHAEDSLRNVSGIESLNLVVNHPC